MNWPPGVVQFAIVSGSSPAAVSRCSRTSPIPAYGYDVPGGAGWRASVHTAVRLPALSRAVSVWYPPPARVTTPPEAVPLALYRWTFHRPAVWSSQVTAKAPEAFMTALD